MSKNYTEGSVWRISFVKVAPGKMDQYLAEIGPLRKRMMDEAIAKGYVLSHKVFNGLAMGRDDWDFMFMVEYKDWAAIDTMHHKMDEVNATCVGSQERVLELVETRSPTREVIGEKFMRELHLT